MHGNFLSQVGNILSRFSPFCFGFSAGQCAFYPQNALSFSRDWTYHKNAKHKSSCKQYFCIQCGKEMEKSKHFNSIDGDSDNGSMQLLSDTIAKAAASAAVAAFRAALSEAPLPQATEMPKQKTRMIKFTKQELNTMSKRLRNYFIYRNKIVRYRFHKGVFEINYRRDGIQLYVGAKDVNTLKVRFVNEMELYLAQHPECPAKRKSRYDLHSPYPVPQEVPPVQPQDFPPYYMPPYPQQYMAPPLPTQYGGMQALPPQYGMQPLPQQANIMTVLFTDYVAQWLELKKQTVKPRTYDEYERMSRRNFEKDFEGVLLKDMTRKRVQDYLFRFVEDGKYRTAEKLHLAFSCIFDLAAEDLGFISPMKKIVLPYHESKKGSALTKEEEKTLVEFCVSHKDNTASSALLIMLYFGLRRSELQTIRAEENFLVCTTSKQRQGRIEVDRKIPFSPMFQRVLPYVDFSKAKTVNINTIQTTFKRLFPNHHPHELRYTFITRANVCVQKGNYEKIYRIKAVKYQCIY